MTIRHRGEAELHAKEVHFVSDVNLTLYRSVFQHSMLVHGAWHEGPDKSPRIMQATDSSLACTFKYFKDRKKRYSSWLVP